MTPVSQGWTGYLTHLQEHHRYPAVKNLAKTKNDPPATAGGTDCIQVDK